MSVFQTTADMFHMQIGYCIAEWANVDDELFRIFHECLGAPIERSAIVYFRLPGIDIRLGTTDELVRAELPNPERPSGGHLGESAKKWSEIRNELQGLLGTRRRIAHHPVNMNARLTEAEMEAGYVEVNSWFELAVGDNERLRTKSNTQPNLGIEELKTHWRLVNALTEKLQVFFRKYIQKASPITSAAKSPARPGDISGS
jgi:hypothetical protein